MISSLLRTPVLLGFAVLALAQTASAQDLHPSRRPSPAGVSRTFVGDTYVKVTYSRPYMRGRAVFGTPSGDQVFLVPFGQVWRTGANEATELTVSGPVYVAGQRLEAGTYSVFTVPGPTSWTVRLNTQLGMDGTGRLDPETGAFSATYDPADDVVAVEVPSSGIAEDVEQFTIEFRPAAPGAYTDMVLIWERTEVSVRITQAPPGDA